MRKYMRRGERAYLVHLQPVADESQTTTETGIAHAACVKPEVDVAHVGCSIVPIAAEATAVDVL